MALRFKKIGAGAVGLLLAVGHLALASAADDRLVAAAAAQDKAAITSLLKRGVDVNASRADGATALLWAAHFNDAETVDLLLQAGANVNAADDHGVTPLARACENNNLALVDRLLRAGANPNIAQVSGQTPLMMAAHIGNLEIAKTLVAHGADVNVRTTQTGASALMWAISDRRDDITQFLLDHKADVHRSTIRGFTPLMLAARNGDIDTAKRLIQAGATINEPASDGTQLLPYALVVGQADFAMFLIEQGADPNGSLGGVNAIHAAAGPVDMWLDIWMREHGSGVTYTTGSGPMRNPIRPDQRSKLVKALIARGANVNGRITTTAMMMGYVGYPKKGAFEPFACGTGDLRGATPLIVAALSANGTSGGFGGDRGVPSVDASGESFVDIMNVLLAAGADHKLTTDDGTTALMLAAGLGRATFSPGIQRGRRSIGAERAVTTLLDAGADVNAVNEADFTALHGAAFRGLNEVIKVLVDRGARIDARDYRGRTPYRLAEGSKQSFQFQAYPGTAEYIKSLGADVTLGIPGTVQERNRELGAAAAANQQD